MTLSQETAERDQQGQGQALWTLRLRLGGRMRPQVGVPGKVPHGQTSSSSHPPLGCVSDLLLA